MVATTNLNMEHWVAAQAQPEVNHNIALDILDGKMAGAIAIDHAGDADYTLATTGTEPFEWQHAFIDVTNTGTAWTADRTLNVPAESGFYVVRNSNGAGFNVKVQVTGGAGTNVLIANTQHAVMYCDGSDVFFLASSSAATFVDLTDTPGDFTDDGDKQVFVNNGETALEFRAEFRDAVFALTVGNKPTNAQEVVRLTMTHAVTFPSAMTGSQSKAGTASTGNVAFSVKKNGTEFGTITFNITATGVFAAASATSLAIGDQLTILAPATADATLADIGISLKATRD